MTSKILVADDERVVTEVVERYLRLQNYEVSLASDGFQALETARDWHPDLVVLDLMLPGGMPQHPQGKRDAHHHAHRQGRGDRPDSGT